MVCEIIIIRALRPSISAAAMASISGLCRGDRQRAVLLHHDDRLPCLLCSQTWPLSDGILDHSANAPLFPMDERGSHHSWGRQSGERLIHTYTPATCRVATTSSITPEARYLNNVPDWSHVG